MQTQLQAQSRAVQALVVLIAGGLLAVAAWIGPAWMQHHFLPEFVHPRPTQLRTLAIVRACLAVAALALLWPVRPWLGRLAARKPAGQLALDVIPTLVAVLLALVASEVLLQQLPWFADHEMARQREPLRRHDPILGWAFVANHAGHSVLGGRVIDYAFDAAGHRVRAAGQAVDFARPTIVFAGESIIGGHGLTYDESIPARVGARLGLQSANIAVGGYGTDQTYLRLKAIWPRYREPRALVILFMPSLFHRNLETDRPHLIRGLAWRPVSRAPRLVQLARRMVPYHSDAELADGVAMTRQALFAMVGMARAEGAIPLIVVPQLTPETPEEAAIRARVLQGLPALQVRVDPAWHIPNNNHPDARGAAVIADAVAGYIVGHQAYDPARPVVPPSR